MPRDGELPTALQKGWVKKGTIFCGSREGNSPEYMALARETGAKLAEIDFIEEFFYGGGNSGLMGGFAQGLCAAGRCPKITGITMPFFSAAQGNSPQGVITKVVDTFQTRIENMLEQSQLAIALPGAFGTLEEMAVLYRRNDVANIIGVPDDTVLPHAVWLNYKGFYDGQKTQIETYIKTGFSRPEAALYTHFPTSVDELVDLARRLNNEAPLCARDMSVKHAEVARKQAEVAGMAPI